MAHSNTTEILKVFKTDAGLRFRQTAVVAIQLLAIGLGTYILFQMLFDHVIHLGYFCPSLLVISTGWLCYGKISWGNRIEFRRHDILLLRNKIVKCRIFSEKPHEVAVRKIGVRLTFTDNGHIKSKWIGRPGFSEKEWQEFTQYLNTHFNVLRKRK
jgi:hypothetical protein